MKIIDLFAGVGGLSLGFEEAGFTTVASVDLWDDAIETFNHNRSNKVGYVMDIKNFNDNILPRILNENKITGVIGGPPCQGYSSARLSDKSERIDGINEDRNQLYLEFFRTVKMAKPEFFLLENVRGMVSLNNGAFVKDILKRFGQLGYSIDCCDEIVDLVERWLPKEQSAEGSQNTFAIDATEGFNHCLNKIKGTLR
jgi:DNA (cytosine-5)-methyltransferase 1